MKPIPDEPNDDAPTLGARAQALRAQPNDDAPTLGARAQALRTQPNDDAPTLGARAQALRTQPDDDAPTLGARAQALRAHPNDDAPTLGARAQPDDDAPTLGARAQALRAPPDDDAPTLGARAQALRVPRDLPPLDLAPLPAHAAARHILGAAATLATTLLAACAIAWLGSRLLSAIYVTFFTPLILGVLLAAVAGIGARRAHFSDRRTLTWIILAGAALAWLGQHLLNYIHVIEHLAAITHTSTTSALHELELATGQSGFGAYLAHLASPPGAASSPVGMLGHGGLSPIATIATACGELVLLALAARFSLLSRTRALRAATPSAALGWLAPAQLGPFTAAIAARRWTELAPLLDATPSASPTSGDLVIVHRGEVTARLALHPLDPLGRPGPERQSFLVPIDALSPPKSPPK